jgi:hypothetical protein
VLKKIGRPKWEEIRGEWRTLHNEELHNSYSSPDKGQSDEWGIWHTWGRREMHTQFWCGTLMDRDHLEDPRINRRIMLKWVLNTMGGQ